MAQDILRAEIRRMTGLRLALREEIQYTLDATQIAYDAISGVDHDLTEARAAVATDGRMITEMRDAIIHTMDAQIARLNETLRTSADRYHLSLWMDDMSLEAGAPDPEAAARDAAARDAAARDAAALEAAALEALPPEVAALRDQIRLEDQMSEDAEAALELSYSQGLEAGDDGLCVVCKGEHACFVLPCAHRICFDCGTRIFRTTRICPLCRGRIESATDFVPLHGFEGTVYAQLPKQGMLAMQRLLLKL